MSYISVGVGQARLDVHPSMSPGLLMTTVGRGHVHKALGQDQGRSPQRQCTAGAFGLLGGSGGDRGEGSAKGS